MCQRNVHGIHKVRRVGDMLFDGISHQPAMHPWGIASYWTQNWNNRLYLCTCITGAFIWCAIVNTYTSIACHKFWEDSHHQHGAKGSCLWFDHWYRILTHLWDHTIVRWAGWQCTLDTKFYYHCSATWGHKIRMCNGKGHVIIVCSHPMDKEITTYDFKTCYEMHHFWTSTYCTQTP